MRRKQLISMLGIASLLAGPVIAETVEESVTRQLRAQGFDSVRISRTLLGRTRILAEDASRSREIIVNPRTGEVLRDFTWIKDGASSGTGGGSLLRSGTSSSQNGSSGSDDDDDSGENADGDDDDGGSGDNDDDDNDSGEDDDDGGGSDSGDDDD